jgi:hypothetical protein
MMVVVDPMGFGGPNDASGVRRVRYEKELGHQ